MIDLVRAALRWVGKHELGVIVSAAALALGGLVFITVASEVRGGETQAFDRSLMLSMRNPSDLADPIGPRWAEEMGRDFTALGGGGVLIMLSLFVIGYLVLTRKPRAAAFVAGSVVGAVMLSNALKSLFQRPRPDVVPHLSQVMSTSFPSGHTMLSAAVYLTLGALLARLEDSLVVKAYFLLCATFVTLLVGASRVYLGVHFPTDVLAGWAAGAAWAAMCWLVARVLQRQGELEAES